MRKRSSPRRASGRRGARRWRGTGMGRAGTLPPPGRSRRPGRRSRSRHSTLPPTGPSPGAWRICPSARRCSPGTHCLPPRSRGARGRSASPRPRPRSGAWRSRARSMRRTCPRAGSPSPPTGPWLTSARPSRSCRRGPAGAPPRCGGAPSTRRSATGPSPRGSARPSSSSSQAKTAWWASRATPAPARPRC